MSDKSTKSTHVTLTFTDKVAVLKHKDQESGRRHPRKSGIRKEGTEKYLASGRKIPEKSGMIRKKVCLCVCGGVYKDASIRLMLIWRFN
jgi:hypothetical protein